GSRFVALAGPLHRAPVAGRPAARIRMDPLGALRARAGRPILLAMLPFVCHGDGVKGFSTETPSLKSAPLQGNARAQRQPMWKTKSVLWISHTCCSLILGPAALK